VHRTRRRISRFASPAVAAVLALTTLFIVNQPISGASTAPATREIASQPAFPRPGGGPQAIHAYTPLNADHSYLLDISSGEYVRLPYLNTLLSPNRRLVAVESADGGIGVASRRALLRDGESAIRWTGLPGGTPAWWSPDGRALLVTTLDKGDGPPGKFDAYRYDLATGRVRHTPISLDCDICIAGWAADSTRYLVQLRSDDPAVLEGPLRYLDPDGTAGPLLGANGVAPEGGQYSPTGRHLIVEPVRPNGGAQRPAVVDLRTGRVVTTVDTAWPLPGWYDQRRVVRIAPGAGDPVLEVVDIRTGRVGTRVPIPGLLPYRLQLGSSAGLRGEAAALGF
jgi:hypothetical protein